MIQGTWQDHIKNRRTATASQANFRAAPSRTAAALGLFPAGTALYPIASVVGEDVGGSSLWYAALLYIGQAYTLGYFHSSVLGPLQPIEAPGGFTQAQVDAAVVTAIRPLQDRITEIKRKVAAGSADIADD